MKGKTMQQNSKLNYSLPSTRYSLNKDSKIAVFGASGLVGSAIVRKLIENGYTNIIGTIHKRKPSTSYLLPANSYYKIDLLDSVAVSKFFEQHNPEFVFLAAAKVGGIVANNTYKADFIYQNMAIALNVIHSAYKYGVKKLLNLGSSCIYPKFAPQPMKEEYLLTGSLEPTNEPYAIAKISAIKLCRYFNEQYGTNFISAMPTNLYGPGDNVNLETSHVLPALIRKFHLGKCLEENNFEAIRKDLNKNPIDGIDGEESREEILKILEKYGIKIGIRDKGQGVSRNTESNKKANFTSYPLPLTPVSIEIWGSGEVYREFLHVDDMAEVCIYLMQDIDAGNMREYSEDYFVNIGTGEDIKLKDLANTIKEIVDFKGKIAYDRLKPDGTPRKLLDVTKINQLGWRNKTKLEEGIKKVYGWYLELSEK
jgi:GDP-L-fucose synthase